MNCFVFPSSVWLSKLTVEIFKLKVLLISGDACLNMWREPVGKLFSLRVVAILSAEGANHLLYSFKNISPQIVKFPCL